MASDFSEHSIVIPGGEQPQHPEVHGKRDSLRMERFVAPSGTWWESRGKPEKRHREEGQADDGKEKLALPTRSAAPSCPTSGVVHRATTAECFCALCQPTGRWFHSLLVRSPHGAYIELVCRPLLLSLRGFSRTRTPRPGEPDACHPHKARRPAPGGVPDPPGNGCPARCARSPRCTPRTPSRSCRRGSGGFPDAPRTLTNPHGFAYGPGLALQRPGLTGVGFPRDDWTAGRVAKGMVCSACAAD
jgi:hypothetical protein